MKRWILLKDLPIEKKGTIITVKDGDYVVEDTGISFPYAPHKSKWFQEILPPKEYPIGILSNGIIEHIKEELNNLGFTKVIESSELNKHVFQNGDIIVSILANYNKTSIHIIYR